MTARSQPFLIATSIFANTIVRQVPVGQILILKSIYVRNTTGSATTPRAFTHDNLTTAEVDLLNVSLAAGTTERWDGLIVLNENQYVGVKGGVTGVHFWCSGSLLSA